MFFTTEFSRIKNPFLNAGEHGWSQVELMLNAPWYFCSISERKNSEGFTTNLILNNINQVINLASESNIEVKEIYLISPGYVNKSNCWKMDKIFKILKSTNHELIKSNPVYKILKEDESALLLDVLTEVKDIGFKFENLISFERAKNER